MPEDMTLQCPVRWGEGDKLYLNPDDIVLNGIPGMV